MAEERSSAERNLRTPGEKPGRVRQSLAALRIVVAALLSVHGVARVALGGVDDFGVFLDLMGFPAGAWCAWAVTVAELLGAPILALGRWVRPLAIYFAGQLTLGVALVHFREGWFVVGAGRNGMEYSALLIAVLLALAWAAGGLADEADSLNP